MNKLKVIFSFYVLLILGLFFYTFTQVDLSLTLSKASLFLDLEKQFQYIGFYQRPISAVLFSLIVILMFLFYFFFLYLAKKERLKIKDLKILTFLTFLILVFSYNAFSYDLFNYIFDAKIVTFYSQNPYFHKPLDFVGDPMLNFMRWTHRLYPYGPVWLMLTVPLSFIGMNVFLPTFFLFKIMIGLSFVGSGILIYKISEIIFPKDKIFNTVFWLFNPLVIIEGLVSAHNDFPMIFLFLLSIYLFLVRRKTYSFLSYISSIAVKYSTGAILPVFLYVLYLEKKNKSIPWERIFLLSLIFSIFTLFLVSFRTTFQPWYLILSLSIASFIARRYFVFIPFILASFFGVSFYIVYVYMTDYAKEYPEVILNLELISLACIVITTLIYFAKVKLLSKH